MQEFDVFPPVFPLTIQVRKELREAVLEMRARGMKVAPSLALVLGRFVSGYPTTDKAVDAISEIFREYSMKHVDEVQQELKL